MAYDPDWASDVALLHFDGANGSTTFTDEVGLTVTTIGGAQISNTRGAVGSATSMACNGTNATVSIAPGAHFQFDGDFTVEAFIYLTASHSGVHSFLSNRGAGKSIVINIYGNNITLYDGSSFVISGGTVAQNAWHHVALSRTGTAIKLFLDGVQQGSTYTDGSTFGNITQPFRIGGDPSYGQYLTGFMDEVRFTKGVGRYTANFTPPVEPFSWGVTTTLSGVTLDRTGAPAQRQVFIYSRATGAMQGSILSDPITGEWSVFSDGACFGVCIADDSLPLQSSLLLDRLVPV